MRKYCEDVESSRQIIEDINDGKTGTTWLYISDNMECALFLSRTPPRLGSVVALGVVSWIYTVDLDQLVFTIDNSAHLDLFRIPRGNDRAGEWIRYIALDGRGCRCLKLGIPSTVVPDLNNHLSHVAESISKKLAKIQGHITYQEMNMEKFKEPTSLMMFQECAAQMAKGFIISFLQVFGDARNYHPSTANFQEKAAFLLSLLAPGSSTTPLPTILDCQWRVTVTAIPSGHPLHHVVLYSDSGAV